MIIIPEDEMQRMYNNKVASCEERLIIFNFTYEEYKLLQTHKDEFTCFYTNREFRLGDSQHEDYPTLERIDPFGPYSPENTVFVTAKANRIKATYIETEHSMKGLDQSTVNIIQRIKKVLSSKEMIEKQFEPYVALYKSNTPKARSVFREHNLALQNNGIEAIVAQKYSEFIKMLTQADVVCHVTYNQYKSKLLSTNCYYTGRELPSDVINRTVQVLDFSKPVSNSNIVVTDVELSKALTVFIGSCKLNSNDVKALGKRLSKL